MPSGCQFTQSERMMQVQKFGTLPDGSIVYEVKLSHGGLFARFITWGAVLRDLRLQVADAPRPVVLGFGKLSDYLTFSRNHGANVGRYGGRIRDGRLVVSGTTHALSRNLDGRHHLHGGTLGLGRRNWRLAGAGESWVVFEIHSPAGDQGYPGALTAVCRYDLNDYCLAVTIDAVVTEPSPVNFLHHSYFNLDGHGLIHAHRLQILADQMIPFDGEGLPTGQIIPVAGTRYDFRELRVIPYPALYDASFILPGKLMPTPRLAARLKSGDGHLRMDVHTTEPGLHFYSGFAVKAPIRYQDGRPCAPETGLCLEATRFNDTPNKPQFGDVICDPSRPYHQRTEFHFSRDKGSLLGSP